MIILGITGTNGAGKGTVADYLRKQGFGYYSVRGFLMEELEKRGIPANRDTLTELANELRRSKGASYILDTLYERAERAGTDAVIESIRTVGEVKELRKKGMLLLAVDANPDIRYGRVALRKSVTDNVSLPEFMMQEERESKSDDPSVQNLKHTVALADFTLNNDGNLEQLYADTDAIIEKIRSYTA